MARGWASAAPNVGPSFKSSAFRVENFAKEAKYAWNELSSSAFSVNVAPHVNIDCSGLRLSTLTELTLAKVHEERTRQPTAAACVPLAGTMPKRGRGRPRGSKSRGGKVGSKGRVNIQRMDAELQTADAVLAKIDGPNLADVNKDKDLDKCTNKLRERDPYSWNPEEKKPILQELEKVLNSNDITFNASRRGRYKTYQPGDKPRNRISNPILDGEGREIEEQRKLEFKEAGAHLKSIQQSLAAPLLHITPFQEKNERVVSVAQNPLIEAGDKLLEDNEVILRIEIRVFDSMHETLQEVLVPGCQEISALRDVITCVADRNAASVGMHKQAAFFYIEGSFYVDQRNTLTDLISPIHEFCKKFSLPVPCPPEEGAHALPCQWDIKQLGSDDLPVEIDNEVAFFGSQTHISGSSYGTKGATLNPIQLSDNKNVNVHVHDMCDVQWNELGLRCGAGARNMYCHQGCCEHLVNIRDVRLIHSDDPKLLSQYPLVIQKESIYRRLCNVCNDSMARYVTYDDEYATQVPAFWCEDCYRLMHYDVNDKLAYPHKVFTYNGG